MTTTMMMMMMMVVVVMVSCYYCYYYYRLRSRHRGKRWYDSRLTDEPKFLPSTQLCETFTVCIDYFCQSNGLGYNNNKAFANNQTPPRYRNAASGSYSRLSCTRPRIAIRPITAKRDIIHENRSTQRRQRRTEPQPQGICTNNFVKIGPAGPEICSRRHTDRNTPLPYRGGVITWVYISSQLELLQNIK